ncbi:hypothetical protein E3O28_10480 [Cryobacterium sp. TMT2-14]|nr:hypothetical protein E3O28_10480 [Cryobacterium sp. TMT2-14]
MGQKNWGASRLLAATTLPIGPRARWRLSVGTVLSSGLMIAIGVLTVVLAVQGPGMAPDGWQVELAAALGHWAAVIQQFLAFIPGWISTLTVFSALGALVWTALRSRKHAATPTASGNRPDQAHTRAQTEKSQ